MKKGISDAMFAANWDVGDFLKKVGEVGFDGVELNYWENGGALNPNTTSVDVKHILSLSDQFNVEIGTLSTGLLNNYPISSSKKDLRDEGLKIASHMIDLAADMGVEVIQLVPGVATADTLYADSYNYALESLSYLGDKASKVGVKIGIENVCNKFLPSAGEYSRFLNELNHPSVKAYFDNGNALATGYIDDFIYMLGDQIIAIHLKDYSEETGVAVSMLEGDTNWFEMMKALEDISYEGYLICTPTRFYNDFESRIIHQNYEDLESIMNVTKKTVDI